MVIVMAGVELLLNSLRISNQQSGVQRLETSPVGLMTTLQQHHLGHQWYLQNVGVLLRIVFVISDRTIHALIDR